MTCSNIRPPADIADALAAASHRLGPIGAVVAWYPEIGSTNDAAVSLAESGAPHGALVLADAQTSGRGRLGRPWASPAGAGLYASIVLRPNAPVAPLIALMAGVAVAEGIEAATGLVPALKWPNDVILLDATAAGGVRKLAGILAEGGTSPSAAPWVVLGVGINLRPAQHPPEVAARATSIEAELGRGVDRGLVLAECLAAIQARFAQLCDGHAAGVVAAWRERAMVTFGRRIEWDGGEGAVGTIENVDADGALVVRTAGGRTRIVSGEIRWR